MAVNTSPHKVRYRDRPVRIDDQQISAGCRAHFLPASTMDHARGNDIETEIEVDTASLSSDAATPGASNTRHTCRSIGAYAVII